jgi:hypothetical protein
VWLYVLAISALLLAAIVPAFAPKSTLLWALRPLSIFAVYPLFLVMLVTHGISATVLTWIAFVGVALVLELIAEATSPSDQRTPLLRTLRNVAVAWPLTIPSALQHFFVQLGVAKPEPLPTLPDPPRGDALVALSDDEMLSAAHQILSGPAPLSNEERTILIAESFNRELHGGGFKQMFANADYSVSDTAQSLRAVGASRNADLLQRAATTTWPASLDDAFFALEREEDLTALIAAFLRQNRSRCPALST